MFLMALSVCVSVCLYYDNLQQPRRKKFIFGLLGYLYGIRVKFIYKGHQVKVKVTAAETRNFIFPQCKPSIGNNSGSVEDRVMKFVCSAA